MFHFWIDVGGTFTDCIGRGPDGRLTRHKLLSSGVTKGGVGRGSGRMEILDPARRADPPDFWTGYTVRLLDRDGRGVAEATVAGFDRDRGSLQLNGPLDDRVTPLISDSLTNCAAARRPRSWPSVTCSGCLCTRRFHRSPCGWAPREAPMP